MARVSPPGLRILVGAGSFADAAEALRIVVQLPDRLLAGLGGVLVEEPDTLATCQIPNQRIILLSGDTARAPGLVQLRAILDADAKAFRQSLARAAKPAQTEWVFTQDRGDLVDASLRAAHGWDILVIGYRRVNKVTGKVILLTSSTPPSIQMNEAANNLSRQFGANKVVLAVDPTGSGPQTLLTPDIRQVDTFEQSLHALARINALAVLVDLTAGPLQQRHDLARLLEAARCPLIVFGASEDHPVPAYDETPEVGQ